MTDCFAQVIAFTRAEEGGYSDDANDGGNWSTGEAGRGRFIGSKWGVGAPALISWLGPKGGAGVTASTMKAMPDATYQAIARARYWRAMGCDGLPGPVAFSVFDFGWNTGDGNSVSVLQGAVGCTVDGDCGPQTIAAVSRYGAVDNLLGNLASAQARYYHALSNFAQYGQGWIARTLRRQSAALKV